MNPGNSFKLIKSKVHEVEFHEGLPVYTSVTQWLAIGPVLRDFFKCKHFAILWYTLWFITGHTEVAAKVNFLLVSVILLTGKVCLSACWEGSTPLPGRKHTGQREAPSLEGSTPLPGRKHPHPGRKQPPGKEAPSPPTPEGSTPSPPEGSTPPWKEALPPRHTVNERPVRILLECILLYICD